MPQRKRKTVPESNASSLRRALTRWFRIHGRDLPWRRTTDPYAILVSEIMLQQTQVATVIPYHARWMVRFPTVQSLAEAPEEVVFRFWQGLGYYARARNLHRAVHAIVASHCGVFPTDPALIRALPGVGPYTAGAVAAFAFDRPEPLVDANIARVLARVGDIHLPIDSTAGRRALWSLATDLQPSGSTGGRVFNSALMELGALVCTPRNPRCPECPIRRHCRATDPSALPIKAPRRQTRQTLEDRAWIVRDGSFLAGREPGNRWRGLWVLPRLRTAPGSGTPLAVLKHPVMHYQITLRVWRCPKRRARPDERWVSFSEATDTPMPAPHRKVVARLSRLTE